MVQEGQCTPSPLFPGYATCKGKGHMQGEGLHARGRSMCKRRGKDQGGCTQGEGLHARGGGGFASKQAGLCTNRRGHTLFLHPLCPVDQLRKIPCTVLVNKI